jgi:hypothetical protein
MAYHTTYRSLCGIGIQRSPCFFVVPRKDGLPYEERRDQIIPLIGTLQIDESGRSGHRTRRARRGTGLIVLILHWNGHGKSRLKMQRSQIKAGDFHASHLTRSHDYVDNNVTCLFCRFPLPVLHLCSTRPDYCTVNLSTSKLSMSYSTAAAVSAQLLHFDALARQAIQADKLEDFTSAHGDQLVRG